MSAAQVTCGRSGKAYNDSGKYALTYYLAPPQLAKRNGQGELQKCRFGPWVKQAFLALSVLKGLRGTPFNVFGWTAERRTERKLISEYASAMHLALPHQIEHPEACLDLAQLPQQIRGYGHVKEVSIERARTRHRELLAEILGKEPPGEQATGYGQYFEGAWS